MPPPVRNSPEPTSGSVPVRVRWLLACCLGLAVAALAGEARPDLGVSPGANGLIAFQSFRGGSSQIYLETVPPTRVRRLTEPRHCYAVPAWSPDGKWIAFEYNPSPTGLRSGASDIYVMNPSRGGRESEAVDARDRVRRRSGLVAEREKDRLREHPQRERGHLGDERRRNQSEGICPGSPAFDGDPGCLREAAASPSRVHETETGRST